MESPGDYMESPMDGDDIAYPCKGCGEILEEGKAFELAGNRWHLNCFRCNTCQTLLDSDANLLLLGDGSLICNNCTYSCSACGNKIEDLAILTGDQAFCAACFRCRNCKRKIDNLRYARTSQGIFCMSCHESLMARRRKKSKAAQSKREKEQSSAMVDKSLPALPPNAVPTGAFSQKPDTPKSVDTDTPTELSPRPRTTYPPNDSSSTNNPHRARSPERPSAESTNKESLTLPSSTYRKNRHSAISQLSDLGGPDGESFFIPLALDAGPAAHSTPKSVEDERLESGKVSAEKKSAENDYFALMKKSARGASGDRAPSETNSQSSTPHIAFQDKGRQPSSDHAEKPKESVRKPAAPASEASTAREPPSFHNADTKAQGGVPKSAGVETTLSPRPEKFRLQEVPKNKRAATAKEASQPELAIADREKDTARSNETTPTTTVSSNKLLPAGRVVTPRRSLDSRLGEETGSRALLEPNDPAGARMRAASSTSVNTIPRKEVPASSAKNPLTQTLSRESSTSTSTSASSGTTEAPTINGKKISAPVLQSATGSNGLAPAQPTRPAIASQKSDTYMAPRTPPAPPMSPHKAGKGAVSSNAEPVSPKLPRWSAGGDFTMDEDMARILGTDEGSQSILRRVSNAVRHGRTTSESSGAARYGHNRSISETTRTAGSPRVPRTSITEHSHIGHVREISSPISLSSPGDDAALLRRQLRNSEQRVAELERQFASAGELQNINKKLVEKKKTASVLDAQAELMIRQLEVLAGFVEKAKESRQPMNIAELEESAIKEFVQKIDKLKQNISGQVEALLDERNALIEEKEQAMKDRDRAVVEFEQLSMKNAQLADMNNDLTHQIQERFKAQTMNHSEGQRPANGLGIYANHSKSGSSVQAEDASLRSNNTTLYGSGTAFSIPTDQESRMDPMVVAAPHVIDIRKGQAKKFNWKKGGATVAKGVSKGLKGAFSSDRQEKSQWQTQPGDNIGLPYNMTVASMEPPISGPLSARQLPTDPRGQSGGFGLFKKTNMVPKTQSNGSLSTATTEHPSSLFGSDLVERAEYERRQIPSVVTRCIEEVELRGMDVEGIYRKTGGSGQVKQIQEGFEKSDDFDISDPGMDITAVTSVLKQYFRKLPTPLLTFDIYDRVLESLYIEDNQDRCAHLRQTFSQLPQKHRDCLEFLIFHLVRVATRNKENLMTPKNLAVVFAPTIMRDHSLEREMTDMQSRNDAVQFVIEHGHEIFTGA